MSKVGSKLGSNPAKYQLKRCTTTQHRTRRINTLVHLLPFIETGDRLRVELPLIGYPGEGRSYLNLVDAVAVDRLKGPQLIPFKPAGMPLLITKIVSAVSAWSNDHAEVALRSDRGCKLTHREGALQESFSERETMDDGAGIGPSIVIRSYGLRVEEIEVGIADVL